MWTHAARKQISNILSQKCNVCSWGTTPRILLRKLNKVFTECEGRPLEILQKKLWWIRLLLFSVFKFHLLIYFVFKWVSSKISIDRIAPYAAYERRNLLYWTALWRCELPRIVVWYPTGFSIAWYKAAYKEWFSERQLFDWKNVFPGTDYFKFEAIEDGFEETIGVTAGRELRLLSLWWRLWLHSMFLLFYENTLFFRVINL